MTAEDELDFQNSIHCYICEKRCKIEEKYCEELNGDKSKINYPVRDHCHITGKYRGSAHNYCNLQLRIDPEKLKIPVIFHNLQGYDSHFIIKKLEKILILVLLLKILRNTSLLKLIISNSLTVFNL